MATAFEPKYGNFIAWLTDARKNKDESTVSRLTYICKTLDSFFPTGSTNTSKPVNYFEQLDLYIGKLDEKALEDLTGISAKWTVEPAGAEKDTIPQDLRKTFIKASEKIKKSKDSCWLSSYQPLDSASKEIYTEQLIQLDESFLGAKRDAIKRYYLSLIAVNAEKQAIDQVKNILKQLGKSDLTNKNVSLKKARKFLKKALKRSFIDNETTFLNNALPLLTGNDTLLTKYKDVLKDVKKIGQKSRLSLVDAFVEEFLKAELLKGKKRCSEVIYKKITPVEASVTDPQSEEKKENSKIISASGEHCRKTLAWLIMQGVDASSKKKGMDYEKLNNEDAPKLDINDLRRYIQIFFPHRFSDAACAYKLSQLRSIVDTEMSMMSSAEANQVARRSLLYFQSLDAQKYKNPIEKKIGQLATRKKEKDDKAVEWIKTHLMRKFEKHGADAIAASEAFLDPGMLQELSKGKIRETDIVKRRYLPLPWSKGYFNFWASVRAFVKRFVLSIVTMRHKGKQNSIGKIRKNANGELTNAQKFQFYILGTILAAGKIGSSVGTDLFVAPDGQLAILTDYYAFCNGDICAVTRGKAFYDFFKFLAAVQDPYDGDSKKEKLREHKARGFRHYLIRFCAAGFAVLASAAYLVANLSGSDKLAGKFTINPGSWGRILFDGFLATIAGLSYNTFYIPNFRQNIKNYVEMLKGKKSRRIALIALTLIFGTIQFCLSVCLLSGVYLAAVAFFPTLWPLFMGLVVAAAAVLTIASVFSTTAAIVNFFAGKDYKNKQDDFRLSFKEKTFAQKLKVGCNFFKLLMLIVDPLQESFHLVRNGLRKIVKDVNEFKKEENSADKKQKSKQIGYDIVSAIVRGLFCIPQLFVVFINRLTGFSDSLKIMKKLWAAINKKGVDTASTVKWWLLGVVGTIAIPFLYFPVYVWNSYIVPINFCGDALKNVKHQWRNGDIETRGSMFVTAPLKMIWALAQTLFFSPFILIAQAAGDLQAYSIASAETTPKKFFEDVFNFIPHNAIVDSIFEVFMGTGNVLNSVCFTWFEKIIDGIANKRRTDSDIKSMEISVKSSQAYTQVNIDKNQAKLDMSQLVDKELVNFVSSGNDLPGRKHGFFHFNGERTAVAKDLLVTLWSHMGHSKEKSHAL
jgi:hypothetical protein